MPPTLRILSPRPISAVRSAVLSHFAVIGEVHNGNKGDAVSVSLKLDYPNTIPVKSVECRVPKLGPRPKGAVVWGAVFRVDLPRAMEYARATVTAHGPGASTASVEFLIKRGDHKAAPTIDTPETYDDITGDKLYFLPCLGGYTDSNPPSELTLSYLNLKTDAYPEGTSESGDWWGYYSDLWLDAPTTATPATIETNGSPGSLPQPVVIWDS